MKARLEQVNQRKDLSFVCQAFDHSPIHCHYHYHPEIELALITAGRGQRLIGDHLGPFGPGDLVLIGADLPHSYFSTSHRKDKKTALGGVVLLQFHPEMGQGLLQGLPELRSFTSLFQRAARGLTFSPRVCRKVSLLLKLLPRRTGPRRIILLMEILAALAQDHQTETLASPGFSPEINQHQVQRIERVCAWVSTHFQECLTLNEAARLANMSPAAFSRFFHCATARPFIRFVNEIRIGHASRLLLETDKSIAEIAFESGFENLSNFNRRFREIQGTVPRHYRATTAEIRS
jgi:AraC-like DNA-binding protein